MLRIVAIYLAVLAIVFSFAAYAATSESVIDLTEVIAASNPPAQPKGISAWEPKSVAHTKSCGEVFTHDSATKATKKKKSRKPVKKASFAAAPAVATATAAAPTATGTAAAPATATAEHQ